MAAADFSMLLDEKVKLRGHRIKLHVHRKMCKDCRNPELVLPTLEVCCSVARSMLREVEASEAIIMLIDMKIDGDLGIR